MKQVILPLKLLFVTIIVITQGAASHWRNTQALRVSRVHYTDRVESPILPSPVTKLAVDVWPGTDASYASNFTSYNSSIYFSATDAEHGRELWKYDGTSASLVSDINPSGDSGPQEFIVYKGILYFSADDGTHGWELWKYDGATTSMVSDIMTGSEASTPGYFTIYNENLFFAASSADHGRSLWKYDGTDLTWVTDEINPYGSSPQELIVFNNELYFAAADHWNGPDPAWELWKYDGTHESLVADINPGDAGSNPNSFAVYNNKLYFAAIGSYEAGMEFWVYDGTSASQVADLRVGTANSSDPNDLTVFNNRLFFSARIGNNTVLWNYDGTNIAPVSWPFCTISAPMYGPSPVQLTVYGGALYFGAEGCNDTGRELWKVDATGKASLVKEIWPGSGSSDPYSLEVIDNVLYFNANDGIHGTEMWSYSALGPSAPLQVSPLSATAAKSLRPTFTWKAVSTATSYTLQIAKNEAFSTLVSNINLGTTTYTPGADLPRNTPLFWRVRATNSNGPGTWSEKWSLSSPNPPGVPTLISPAKNFLSTNYTPLFKWSIAALPTGTEFKYYQLQVDNNSNFLTPEIDDVSATDRLVPQFSSSPLAPNSTFYWRVRSFNKLDEFSNWSTVGYFRTAILPPLLTAPTDQEQLNAVRPALSWQPADGAGKYQLIVSPYENLSSPILNVSVTGTNYTPATNWSPNKTLFWIVRALGTNGPSLPSEKRSFTTGNPASIPVLVTLPNGSLTQDYTPAFDWKDSVLPSQTTLVNYQIQVDTNGNFSAPAIDRTSPTSNYTTTNDLALSSNTRYYWRVRAINDYNGNEQISAWSSVWNFRTALQPPTLLSPANLSTGVLLKPPFTWQSVSGATSYTIQVSTSTYFSTLNLNTTTAGLTYTPLSNLPSGKQIYWRVRANGTNGPSAWSEPWTFNQPVLSVPTIISPADNASLRVPVVLQWNAVALATKYQVRYIQPGNDIYVTQPEQTTLSFTLYEHNTWLWQVRSGDALGNWSDWSTPYHLDALAGAFDATPVITFPASGTVVNTLHPQIKWTVPLHASGWFYGDDRYQVQFDNNSDFTSPEYDSLVNLAWEGPFSNATGYHTLVPKDWLPSSGNQMDIPPDGTYSVRVQGITSDGLKSDWSAPITVELQLSYTSCSPAPDGPQTYNFGWGPYSENYPKLQSFSLDDQLPDPDQTVTVSVHMIVEPYHAEPANHLSPITEMVLNVATDHQLSDTITMTLISGTGTDGIWQGQWTPNDSFCFRYRYIFNGINGYAPDPWPFDIVIRDGDYQ